MIQNKNQFEYDSNLFWSPELYIENIVPFTPGVIFEDDVTHRIEINEKEGQDQDENNINLFTVRVYEMRKVKGSFFENLELNDFPMDMQELSIGLASKKSVDEVELVENKADSGTISGEYFTDLQEWDLSDHVQITNKLLSNPSHSSCFIATCFITRRSGHCLYK